jgi:phosphatidylserine/phosphatidylglycerophosphate/cardiolipin synthase-like enzyme
MRRVVVLLAMLLPLSLLPVVNAGAYEAPGGATFNTPVPWGTAGERVHIVAKVEEAIRQIRPTKRDPHPQLIIAAYLFDRKKSADALIGACRRGVNVRVIIDRAVVSHPLRRIVTALNADNVRDSNHDGVADTDPRAGRCNRPLPAEQGGLRTKTRRHGIPLMDGREMRASLKEPTGRDVTWGRDGSYVLQCSGSCRGGDEANMHAKIYAFSHLGNDNNVVMFASTNLNAGGINSGWNDLIVMKNRPKTFAFVDKMHRLMTAQKKAGRQLVELKDGPYTTRFFPMIGVGKRRDPLMVDLRKVRCTSAFGPTQIYIQQFWWNGHRGNYIWDKIHSLARNGCKVHVIFGAVDSDLLRRMKAARSANFEIWDSRWDSSDIDGCVNTRTHMKNIAIRGTYGKNHKYAGVWTGTANWATGSLTRGDEVTLNVRSASLYKQYAARWKTVKAHSSLTWTHDQPDPPISCVDDN